LYEEFSDDGDLDSTTRLVFHVVQGIFVPDVEAQQHTVDVARQWVSPRLIDEEWFEVIYVWIKRHILD
jgi:hypothetical protein